MHTSLRLVTSPQCAATDVLLKQQAADTLGIPSSQIHTLLIRKKSIDARSKAVKVNLVVDVYTENDQPDYDSAVLELQAVHQAPAVLIVGSGPAGLFGALRLIELGYKPIVLERGKDVGSRKRDIARLSKNEGLDPESNYCYGEGGAGTFSDGKLYTRSNKRGDTQRILRIFHHFGAGPEIIFDAHPHIGTDVLPRIIKNMRTAIQQYGGEVHFESCVHKIQHKSSEIQVTCTNGTQYSSRALLLATGHSAGDMYSLFEENEWLLEPKGFAMGVRVEHPQAQIDRIQYHLPKRGPYLPAATYQLTAQVKDRGVYSFCMCPGGYIVNASTEAEQCVVNGMSSSQRHTPFANAGIVVQILPEDIPEPFRKYGALAGWKYQRYVENLAYTEGYKSCASKESFAQRAPAQRLMDFVQGKPSLDLPQSSYLQGLVASNLHQWLPEPIRVRLQEGFKVFEQKMRGFLSPEALVVGVESRSSSPVRIPRDPETYHHPQVPGLFPCGEGAGYAGGITSSAMDGEICAQKIANYLNALSHA